ncbi:hypothetical protein AGLY_011672 [Aphis glycines]|uniref:Uncharacterized protein n=1 Tax=Aphis glycines TaxID=307491 RepID=A0A6G0TAV7_APHGL|nr:hypothetical protein AGLY_011672 [Aphis glycines]
MCTSLIHKLLSCLTKVPMYPLLLSTKDIFWLLSSDHSLNYSFKSDINILGILVLTKKFLILYSKAEDILDLLSPEKLPKLCYCLCGIVYIAYLSVKVAHWLIELIKILENGNKIDLYLQYYKFNNLKPVNNYKWNSTNEKLMFKIYPEASIITVSRPFGPIFVLNCSGIGYSE